MFALAFVWLLPLEGRAQTAVAPVDTHTLFDPAYQTSRALTGVYTSVARAGNRLVAVGERGWIIVSDDNGVGWHQVASPTSVTLTHVTFATAVDGWVVGGRGVVLHSTDGGLTWTRQFDGIKAGSAALAAAQADVKQSGTNAATTANLQAAQAIVAGGPSVPFLDVYATSVNDVMIAGAFGMAFSSSDGGSSWQSMADLLPNPDGLHIYQILRDGDNLAVAGEQGLLLYGPSGKPLAAITSPFQGTFFGEVLAPDQSWIVFGLQGTIMRSTDHGVHWATIAAGAAVGIDCGVVLKNGAILLGNIAGQLLYSTTNGQNFTVINANEPVASLTQAADGSIIVIGPNGPQRLPFSKIAAGA